MHCIKFVGKVLNQDITNNNMRVLFLSLVSLITTFVNTIYLNYIYSCGDVHQLSDKDLILLDDNLNRSNRIFSCSLAQIGFCTLGKTSSMQQIFLTANSPRYLTLQMVDRSKAKMDSMMQVHSCQN